MYGHPGTNDPEALAEIDDVQWAALARSDSREGAMALIERRAPSFPACPDSGRCRTPDPVEAGPPTDA